MKLAWQFLLVAVAASALSVSTRAQGQAAFADYEKIQIITEKIAPNIYILSGSADLDEHHPDAAGGKIGILAGPDGIFMVDAQYAQLSEKVLAAVRKISPLPIRYLVNSHAHGDHTAGDAGIVKTGATLFAKDELRQQLLKQSPTRDPAGVPVVTYGMGAPVKFYMNGEIVDLIPMPPAHTSGDTLIKFEKADVIMIGDFYRSFGYPFIATDLGGTLKGLIEALDQTVKLAGPTTKIVPGHGQIVDRTAVAAQRDMIIAVQNKVQQLISQGKTQQEVLAAKVTSPYDAKVPGGLLPAAQGGTSADRFVGAVYGQLKGAK